MSEVVAQQAEEQEPEVDLAKADAVIDKYIDLRCAYFLRPVSS